MGELPAVDEAQHEPVGQYRAQFLHEVEGEACAARTVGVEEAHLWVQPVSF